MDLLRPAWVGPLWRLEIGRQLEPDARGFVISCDDGKVVFLPGDWQAEELGVEPRERSRVGTVHDHVVKASDHGSILPRRHGAATGSLSTAVVWAEVRPPRPPSTGIGPQPLREPRPASCGAPAGARPRCR